MTIRLPTHRPPTHSGEMLLEEFLKPMGISQRQLAAAIFVPYSRINKLINGEGRVTAGLAYRLSKFLGTTPEFWLNGQLHWDLWHALRSEAAALERIQPVVWEDYVDPDELAAARAAADTAAEPVREEVAAG